MKLKAPTTLHEALRLAADLAERGDKLERELSELRMNNEYPEVLRPAHLQKLFHIGLPTVTEWTKDPNFPILNKGRKKGESVYVLKSDLYEWLRNRSSVG